VYILYINARRNFILCVLSRVPFSHYPFNTMYFKFNMHYDI
jgi:hypothetical protein